MAPALEDAVLVTKAGSRERTGPAGLLPDGVRVPRAPFVVMFMFMGCPPLTGTLARVMGLWSLTHGFGTPRPMMSEPSPRSAMSESSSTRFASAAPQPCGEAPAPAVGWRPVHGGAGSGACTVSHPLYGPLWGFAIMDL